MTIIIRLKIWASAWDRHRRLPWATAVVEKVGVMDTELMEEFFRAFASHGGLTLHINLHYGKNQHHIFEAVFKALAHALRRAWIPDAGLDGQPLSTKGML